MKAMLLCAGMGSRLGPLGEALPKPMLPMCGVPILRYGIANLVASGIRDLVINLHHNGAHIEEHLGDGHAFGARIRYTRESSLLGTGGGLKNALEFLDEEGDDEPFLSLNGKLIIDFNPKEVLLHYKEKTPDALGLMMVRRVSDAESWGAVDVDDERDEVRNILGKGRYMFCGVHATRPSVVRRLPDGEACMVRQGYLPWLKDGGTVGAIRLATDAYFAEHSTPERYLTGNHALLANPALKNPPAPLTGVAEGAHIDASAKIVQPVRVCSGANVEAGATIGPHTVLGDGVTVKSGVTVERSVVWANTVVEENLTRAIVTPRETLRL